MMVLYSGSTDPFSQRCRFVLFEKGMDFEIRDIDLYHKPEDINVMTPMAKFRSWLKEISFFTNQTSSTNTSMSVFLILS